MQIDPSASHAFENINRSLQMLNQLNQTIVDQSQDIQNKMVSMSVQEQVGNAKAASSHIDLQA
ncbi:MAG: hypothetical protein K8S54_17230 [Spirochaetia bacterium]|nr:hypothetical protein [Spirochaetia bacterium]